MSGLFYPVVPQPSGDPFGGRFGINPGLIPYLIGSTFDNSAPSATPPSTPGGVPGIPGTPSPGGNGGTNAGGFLGGSNGRGNDGAHYAGTSSSEGSGLLPGRFLPGWASTAVGMLPYGIGTAINGVNALSGLASGAQQLGFLGQKMSIGDALSAMTGMNLGYHAQGVGGYGNIGIGGYTGMQNMADPGVMGAARALAASSVSNAFGSGKGGSGGGGGGGGGNYGGGSLGGGPGAMGAGSDPHGPPGSW